MRLRTMPQVGRNDARTLERALVEDRVRGECEFCPPAVYLAAVCKIADATKRSAEDVHQAILNEASSLGAPPTRFDIPGMVVG